MIPTLRTALDLISPLTPAAWDALERLISVREFAAGEHLLHAGQRATRVHFVSQGLLREYYTDGEGKEFTRRFCEAGEFSGSLADLLAARGSLVSIEALEAGAVINWEWHGVEAIAEREPSMERLLRRVAEALYVRKIEREFEMLTLSAIQRYQRFVQSQPRVQARVSRQLIASYLGITPVHLSRIASAGKLRATPAARAGRKSSARGATARR